MGDFKETLCTNCMHRDVCMYREDFLETNNKVDNLECSYYLRKFKNDIR